MNRTDRLLALILQLQAKKCQRAEDLAAHFEISKRTVYRDVEALAEAGVPVISTPGQGFSLVEGYFLPPLSFTADEATMLLLGVNLMAHSFDPELQTAARFASTKIEHVLPELLQTQVERMRESILFVPQDFGQPGEIETLGLLRRAILRQQTIRFTYYARQSDSPEPSTTREADPHKLILVVGNWHLIAYCHLRKDIRFFRLARIENLTLLPKTFVRREIAMARHERTLLEDRPLVVRLLFSPEVTRWVMEDRYYYITDKHETPDGLLVTLHVRRTEDPLQWVLGWGRHVRVLEPETLRDMVIQEAQALIAHHQAETISS
ncbi:MAG TPA: YafY family protein [Phototrophicaceae bacterium]|jgi:predicted DNA-binding transcriptional regulator YafY|nr:YafY family protein [Phototrophicaceae bacterium]